MMQVKQHLKGHKLEQLQYDNKKLNKTQMIR